MTAKTELSAPKRRTRAEVQQLVAEFVNSEMRRSEHRFRRRHRSAHPRIVARRINGNEFSSTSEESAPVVLIFDLSTG
jgi:hypothetical protein